MANSKGKRYKVVVKRYKIVGKRYKIVSNDRKTVKIRFYDTGKIRSYKVIDLADIKVRIWEGKEINLDKCYIKDFSYKELSEGSGKPLMNFHAPRSFWDGKVDFSCAQFGDGDVDFSGAQFGDGDVDFSRAQFGVGKVDFNYAQFGDGKVSFSFAQFGDGIVYFFNAQFGDGDVDFSFAQFGDGIVDFSNAQFGDGKVDFSEAKFGDGDVDFSGAQFGNGAISFGKAQFGVGKVDFGGAQFGGGKVDFSGAQFGDGNVSFVNAQFGVGDVSFYCAQFGDGRYDFTKIAAKNTVISFSDQIINSHITLSFKELKKLVFSDCTNHNVIEIQEAFYEQEDEKPEKAIHELAFSNVCNLGTIRFNWDEYKNALRDFSAMKRIKDLEKAKIDEFKMLKENYHNQGEYDWEDEAYVEFKKRYTAGLKWTKHPLKKLMLKLLHLVGKFGTSYLSIAVAMFVVVLLWGFFYYLCGNNIYPPDTLETSKHWWSPLYYSVITFFTVGYGDLSAQNGWTALLCGAESFLGVFLMSYFSVAVVRKILR